MDFWKSLPSLEFPAPLPQTLLAAEQHLNAPEIGDVAQAVLMALRQSTWLERIASAERIAIGVGSRGISNLPLVVRTVVAELKRRGAVPFVFPAMGSHGGATAEGQRDMLAELGVTEESVGAPILATMEVLPVGELPGGPQLFQDANAASADHTVLINRIKPHTDFRGELESGLSKMAVIGMGKRRGAEAMHAFGGAGFQRFLAPAARVYEENSNLIGGIAILENAYGHTARIEALSAHEIGAQREKDLLVEARGLMGSLPFEHIDVLVVREMGKNISGTGMDTNIIGRLRIPRQPEDFGGPDVAVLVVLDLTAQAEGNASGMGLANITTARLVEKIDWNATYTNTITSGIFGMLRGQLPITMADDRRALQVALRGCAVPPAEARLALITNTKDLDHLWISPSLKAEAEQNPRLRLIGEVPLAFDAQGRMTSPWAFADA